MNKLFKSILHLIKPVKKNPVPLPYVEFRSTISPKAVLIDVRSKEEFDSGHIYTAIHLDFNASDFSQKIKQLKKKHRLFLLYSNRSKRSVEAGQLMVKKGFRKVFYLEGGLSEWTGNLILT